MIRFNAAAFAVVTVAAPAWAQTRKTILDADAAANMLAGENSGYSIDSSVRVALVDRDVPSCFRSPEHLLRYCAPPAPALAGRGKP